MNKSRQETFSQKHPVNGKTNKINKMKLGKRKKQITISEEPNTGKTKRNAVFTTESSYAKNNGTTNLSNPKKNNLAKIQVLKNEEISTQQIFHDLPTDLGKNLSKAKKKDQFLLKNVHNIKVVTQQKQTVAPKVVRQQKRKIQHPITKAKKKKRSESESDSDADDYIDKFFEDVADSDLEEDAEPNTTEEVSDLSDIEFSDEDCEENDGNVMTLDELINFYGRQQDQKQKSKTTSKGKQKLNSMRCNDWVEEENDVDLVYNDSDSEINANCKMLVKLGNNQTDQTESRVNESLSSEDSSWNDDDDNEWMSLEDDQTDSQIGSESFDETVSSGEDYSEDGSLDGEFESDDEEFSSDYDSNESADLDDHPSYWDDSYDSEDDEDYVAEDDDLYISRGTAQIYEIDDNEVSFNSDVESAQIVELPSDFNRKQSFATSETESPEEDNERADCPKLVPIYDAEGKLIDSTEKLECIMNPRVATTLSEPSSAVSTKVKQNLITEKERLSDVKHLNDSSISNNTMDIDEMIESQTRDPNYRIYDSIDMRMSLVVLKKTLFFSGHLTVQPLIGGLEVMGYCLKPGECRSVNALRGFHSLNFTPHPEVSPIPKETIQKVIKRVEKHFQTLDLKEIEQNFDPAVSVLVLLQADCNNKRISVVDKYLSEDFLFPRVEHLNKGPFFTSQYLLNVEFYTEYVEKSTSLFRSDPEWDKIVMKKNSRVVVMGGKGSGKSTLCQYLINKNVSKFRKLILIDLDIGQPIQHIPETISVTVVDRPLLGVATFSEIKPVKSWLFGSLNIVSSLIFYIQNIQQVLRYCEQSESEFANVPWIINTMGYVTDFGEELMSVILRMFSPTDVIQIVSSNKLLAIPNFQNRLTSEFINNYSFNILRNEVQEYIERKATFKHYEFNVCYPKKGFTLNAPKRRFMMLLAHLADILHDTSSEWFNDVKPFCAPLNQLQILITREDQIMTDAQLPSVLNATLVYLCQKVDGGLYECLGIGIVRGVDKNSNVYLLQSLPLDQLSKVNVLAICSSSLPNAVFLRQSIRIQGGIPYVYNIE